MYARLFQKLASTSLFTLGIKHLILASVCKVFAEYGFTDLFTLGIKHLTSACVRKVFAESGSYQFVQFTGQQIGFEPVHVSFRQNLVSVIFV